MRGSAPRWLALSGAALLEVVVLFAATVPAEDYLYVPNGAHPVATKVDVQGKKDPGGPGGIYYVDVTVRKVRWLERLLPFLRPDGASLVPAHAVTAPGESFRDRIAEARVEMDRSEQVAAAVALRAGGLDVTHRGVQLPRHVGSRGRRRVRFVARGGQAGEVAGIRRTVPHSHIRHRSAPSAVHGPASGGSQMCR